MIPNLYNLFHSDIIFRNFFYLPLNFSLLFTLLAIFLIILYRIENISVEFKNIKPKYLLTLGLLFLVGLSIRMHISPWTILHENRHDYEQIIYIINCNSIYHYGNGFVVFNNLFYRFFSNPEVTPFLLNIFVGSLSIILVFVFSFLLFHCEKKAIFSALLFTFLPVHIRYSSTPTHYILVIFFSLLTLTSFLLHISKRNYWYYILGILSLSYTMQIRPDFMIFPVFVFLLYLFIDTNIKEKLKNKKIYLGILLLIFLVSINLTFFMVFWKQVHSWFRFIYIPKELLSSICGLFFGGGSVFLNLKYTPLIFVLLFLYGGFGCFKKHKRQLYFILTSLVLFSYIYLHNSGAPYILRTQNSFQYLYILLSAYGASFLIDKYKSSLIAVLIVSICIINFLPYINFITQKGNQQIEYDFFLENIKKLPDEEFTLVTLTKDDYINRVDKIHHIFPTYLLNHHKKKYKIIDVADFIKQNNIFKDKLIIYYRGIDCYAYCCGNNELNQNCKYMKQYFNLTPVFISSFESKQDTRWLKYKAEYLEIGFYYVAKRSN